MIKALKFNFNLGAVFFLMSFMIFFTAVYITLDERNYKLNLKEISQRLSIPNDISYIEEGIENQFEIGMEREEVLKIIDVIYPSIDYDSPNHSFGLDSNHQNIHLSDYVAFYEHELDRAPHVYFGYLYVFRYDENFLLVEMERLYWPWVRNIATLGRSLLVS